MGQLQTIEGELKQMGYQIIAASPDQPEKLNNTADKNQLTYQLVSDSNLKAAEAFGLVFRLDEATLKKYSESGLEIEEGKLPVPAVFVIRRGGEIAFAYANPDYRVRLDPAVLLAAARAAVDHQPAFLTLCRREAVEMAVDTRRATEGPADVLDSTLRTPDRACQQHPGPLPARVS